MMSLTCMLPSFVFFGLATLVTLLGAIALATVIIEQRPQRDRQLWVLFSATVMIAGLAAMIESSPAGLLDQCSSWPVPGGRV